MYFVVVNPWGIPGDSGPVFCGYYATTKRGAYSSAAGGGALWLAAPQGVLSRPLERVCARKTRRLSKRRREKLGVRVD